MSSEDRLGKVLLELGFVSEPDLARALERQKTSSKKLGRQLVQDGMLSEAQLVSALSRLQTVAAVDPSRTPVHPAVLRLVDKGVAEKLRVIPIARKKHGELDVLLVATADPFDEATKTSLLENLPRELTVEWLLAGDKEISSGLIQHYGRSDSPLPLARAGEIEFGNYVLERRLGSGGMSEIFAARLRATRGASEPLAVKRLLPNLARSDDFRRMFLEEAALCVGLRHPNVVAVYDSGEVMAQPYIAMELVDGCDARWVIDQLKRRQQKMPLPIALHITIELLKALAYVHDAKDSDQRPLGIIHRDVSPANVLLSLWGEVKIGDFGIAKAESREEIRAGSQKGKSGYMAPEQLAGQTIDRRADIFSAGVLLFELLTLRSLFAGIESDTAQISRRLDSKVERSLRHYRPDLPPALDEIFALAVARDPSERYQSAGAFRASLETVRDDAKLQIGTAELSRFLQELSGDTSQAPKQDVYPVPAAPHYEPGPRSGSELALEARRRFVDAPRRVQIAAAVGALAFLGLVLALSLGGEGTEQLPLEAEASDADLEPLPPLEPPAPRPILPGLAEPPLVAGQKFVVKEGISLYSTAAREHELRALPLGQAVSLIQSEQGLDLVMLWPRGPAGFIERGALGERLPAAALAARLPLEGCTLRPKEKLDGCLFRAHQRTGTCLDHCLEKNSAGGPGPRCTEVCEAASERCIKSCRESATDAVTRAPGRSRAPRR